MSGHSELPDWVVILTGWVESARSALDFAAAALVGRSQAVHDVAGRVSEGCGRKWGREVAELLPEHVEAGGPVFAHCAHQIDVQHEGKNLFTAARFCEDATLGVDDDTSSRPECLAGVGIDHEQLVRDGICASEHDLLIPIGGRCIRCLL